MTLVGPELLAQGVAMPSPAWLFCVAGGCAAAPAVGLYVMYVRGKRRSAFHWSSAAIFYVLLMTSLVAGDFGDDPAPAGFRAAMGFCFLLPVGLFLGGVYVMSAFWPRPE